MTTPLRRSAATVTLALVTALGLAACGGSDGDAGSGSDNDSDAAVELTEENLLEEIATAQAEAGSGHVSMAASEASDGVAGEADFVLGTKDGEDTAVRVVMDLGGEDGSAEMRVVDDVLYMSLGETTDGKFLEISDDDESSPLGQLGSIADAFDPNRQLEQIQDNVTSIAQKGEAETIDGIEATPWVVTLDAKALLEEMAEDAGLDSADIPDEVPDEVTYTVFVGPDALPRRYVSDLEGFGYSVDMSKWGEDVTVEKPAADEISDENPFAGLGS